MPSYRGNIIKTTAYGLKFLPKSNCQIIYIVRNIDEVLKSMRKMGADVDGEKDKMLFSKLNGSSFEYIRSRDDMEYIKVNYRDLIDNPRRETERISRLFGETFDRDTAIKFLERSLHSEKAPGR